MLKKIIHLKEAEERLGHCERRYCKCKFVTKIIYFSRRPIFKAFLHFLLESKKNLQRYFSSASYGSKRKILKIWTKEKKFKLNCIK